jgi:hypothetical protein
MHGRDVAWKDSGHGHQLPGRNDSKTRGLESRAAVFEGSENPSTVYTVYSIIRMQVTGRYSFVVMCQGSELYHIEVFIV